MSRPVLLTGAFGQGNPGDEALLTAFAGALDGHVPVAASADPAATAAAHDIKAVRRDDPVGLLRWAIRSDAVVMAGGTVFKTLHPSCGRPPLALLRRAAALAVAAKALRRPLALVGVGAGALESRAARRLARMIVRAADLLVLRDEESAARLAEAGAPAPFRVGADPAWTLLGDAARDAGDGPTSLMRNAAGRLVPVQIGEGAGDGPVVVALSNLAGGDDLPDRLAGGLDPVLHAGVPVQLEPWQAGGDAELARAVARRLGDRAEIVPHPADLRAARDRLARARLVLGLRFHSLVAAAAAGVPFLAYAHEPKLAATARRLAQPAVAPDAPAGELAGAVLGALDGPPPALAAVRHERELAEEGFRLLRVLIARGRSEESADVDGLALEPREWL